MDKHVVFVHGLRRAANVQVWVSSGKPPEVWPLWLEADIEKLDTWSVEHNSALTLWLGNSMPLVDRANNILALLLSEERFGAAIGQRFTSFALLFHYRRLKNGSCVHHRTFSCFSACLGEIRRPFRHFEAP
jgi:hypothetical protein